MLAKEKNVNYPLSLMQINRFNIRVYGILINSDNRVLITDESIKGMKLTKFPGGGLEFGEGVIDCIKREFMEETKNEVEVIKHFYTTEIFQQSVFHSDQQIISINYTVKPVSKFEIIAKEKKYDFEEDRYAQTFRWLALDKITKNDFSLPIDKIVAEMLKKKYN